MYRPKTRRFTGEAAVIGFLGILIAFLCSLTSRPLLSAQNAFLGLAVIVSGINALYELWKLGGQREDS